MQTPHTGCRRRCNQNLMSGNQEFGQIQVLVGAQHSTTRLRSPSLEGIRIDQDLGGEGLWEQQSRLQLEQPGVSVDGGQEIPQLGGDHLLILSLPL